MPYRTTSLMILTVLTLFCSARDLVAQTAYAISFIDDSLIRFDLASPGTVTTIGVFSGESTAILGLDFRPADGQLYGYTIDDKIVTIDRTTAVTMFVSTPSTASSSLNLGVDFNPAADRLRLVNISDQNLRINVATGATLVDGPLAYSAGDTNQNSDPRINEVAYTNSDTDPGTGTQLYYLDPELDILATTTAPNAGTLTTVGSLGVNTDDLTGFDILTNATGTNSAFAVLHVGGSSKLYGIDLGSGAAAFLGNVGINDVLSLAIEPVPEPSSVALLAIAAVTGFALRRRKFRRGLPSNGMSSTRRTAIGSLLAGLLVLAMGAPSQAELLPPGGVLAPVDGAANPFDAFLTGTVLADMTVPFANGGSAPANPSMGQLPVTIVFRGTNAQIPNYLVPRYFAEGATIGALPGLPVPALEGTLRTVVVRETVGGTLDFYLQARNTSATEAPGSPNNIFRVSAGGFNGSGFAGDTLDVFFRVDGGSDDVIPGTTPALVGQGGEIEPISVDRLAENNFDPAFDFSSDLDGGSSIFGGELGRFLLIRTNATAFGPSTVTISSTGTAYVSSFAPIAVPEPSSAALLAIAAVTGFALRRRKSCWILPSDR